jgi:hypothetical protein
VMRIDATSAQQNSPNVMLSPLLAATGALKGHGFSVFTVGGGATSTIRFDKPWSSK